MKKDLYFSDPWWKNAVVYQVYPRSFYDANDDGVGDLKGLRAYASRLVTLGVDAVWLSPVYVSPMRDNGYDIANYDAIDPAFGSLEDFEDVIDILHASGVRLIMDLVVNHTSIDHPWFQESCDSNSPKRDWYIWRAPRSECVPNEDAGPGEWRGDEPNQWRSAFSGPTWTWHEPSQSYYMHLFSSEQPDLNWENPELRQEIYAMMRRWLDRGVDGFRMDVINLISKPENLYEDGPGGLDRAMFGPRFHEYMQEMRREVFDAYPDRTFLTVGEAPGATPDQAALTTDPARRELDMVFQFEHMGLDSADGDKFHPKPLHLPDMKRNLARWCMELEGRGWNSLYLSNHDQPRPVSRFGNDREFRHESATAWGSMLHAHKGTPFIYQGEEIGMANFPWESIDQFNDVETINYWRECVELGGQDPAEVWPGIVAMSRDNARTPVQWADSPHGGFGSSSAAPWLPVNPDYSEVNVSAQASDPHSTWSFYQKMIELRHCYEILTEGSFELLYAQDEHLWWVRREWNGEVLDAVANMSDEPHEIEIPEGEVLLANHADATEQRSAGVLRPWETMWIWRSAQ